jgi:TolA-binding protein
MADDDDIDAEHLNKKMSQMCSHLESVSEAQTQMAETQDEIQRDIKQLHKQMPGDAQLQTKPGCESVQDSIDDKIDNNEARARWRDAGIAFVAFSGIIWHIKRLLASGAHRAADTLKNIVQAWI